MNNSDILIQLFETILARRNVKADTSYTASLFAAGLPEITKKFGEESFEIVIAALESDTDGLISESADLLYHLLVLWAKVGVRPEQVWEVLSARQSQSGLVEKANRVESGQNSIA